MPTERAIDLRNRIDIHQAEQNGRPQLITRPKIQRENCWKDTDNTAFLDTIVRGWACPPIYLISREVEDDQCEEEDEAIDEEKEARWVDEVFDGAHKIEASTNFINDKHTIHKSLPSDSPLVSHIGKKFSQLPNVLKKRFTEYEFSINYIDSITANNPDSLKLLWARLNNSGAPLNDYESSKPTIAHLVEIVLKPSSELFLGSEIFPAKVSKRGMLEERMQMILALAECSLDEKHLKTFTSRKQLVKLWQEKYIGRTSLEVNENVQKNKEKWLLILKKVASYMNYLKEVNCFVNDTGEEILEKAHRGTDLVFILARAVLHISKPEDFRRISTDIATHMKEKYFIDVETQKPKVIRDKKGIGRNGILQREILRDIDTDLVDFAKMKETRCFTKDQIKQKFDNQNGICALCKNPILKNQPYVGDHITPWSLGGRTAIDNCQVTHKRCNLAKSNHPE
jgi:5-methylcytosine-specific restriction endonuclease McrA